MKSAGKRVEASHVWFWFYFWLVKKWKWRESFNQSQSVVKRLIKTNTKYFRQAIENRLYFNETRHIRRTVCSQGWKDRAFFIKELSDREL